MSNTEDVAVAHGVKFEWFGPTPEGHPHPESGWAWSHRSGAENVASSAHQPLRLLYQTKEECAAAAVQALSTFPMH